jgi:exodeoxyribonuclease X
MGKLIRVVDTETTGLGDDAEPVEIGWADMALHSHGVFVGEHPVSEIVRADTRTSFEAMAVHHITQDMSDAAIEHWSNVAIEIADGTLGKPDAFAAHNADYDRKILRATHGEIPWICTWKCALALWPDLESHKNFALAYALDLPEAYRSNWRRYGDPHSCKVDTYITRGILIRLLQEASLETLIAISREPARLVKAPFGKHKGERLTALPLDYLTWMRDRFTPEDDTGRNFLASAIAELRRRSPV